MSIVRYLCNVLVSALPPTRAYKTKAKLWRWSGVVVASDARLVSSVRIWTSGRVSIGADTFLGHEVMLAGGDASISIGARCDLAPRVLLVTGSHEDGGDERAAGRGISTPIVVGNGVWIGAGAILLGGVEIGDGSIIGAGSLVDKSIPPRSIAVGVPCRVVRQR